MRRKITGIAAALILSMGLAACGDSSGSTDNNNTTVSQVAEEKNYSYTMQGVDVFIDGDLTSYVSKLGEPKGGRYEAKSCAFEGMDIFYQYDSVTLQGYQKDGKERLYSIVFMDDAVKTNDGVRIGDKKEKVISSCGSSYKEEDGKLVYEKGDSVAEYFIKDDAVSSIILRLK